MLLIITLGMDQCSSGLERGSKYIFPPSYRVIFVMALVSGGLMTSGKLERANS